MHLAGTYLYFDALAMGAFLPVLAGLSVCYGGTAMLRCVWPSIAFLAFMLPLPYRLEIALSQPLQRLATFCSTYTLQTLGFAAVSEGNVIIMNDVQIGVVEACSGLGMLVTFFAMTTATVLVVRRSLVETIIVVLSAIPIALVANVVRIAVTGALHGAIGGEVADIVYHDLAGWLMMPLALVLLWAEIRLLSILLCDPDPEEWPVLGLCMATRFGAVAAARSANATRA
jgi:exosortase